MRSFYKKITFIFMLVFVFTGLTYLFFGHSKATNSGQMIFYLHKEPADANETYNALALTKPEPGSDTATVTASTANTFNFSTLPTAFCQASTLTSNNQNQVVMTAATANATNTAYCAATFASMPVGQAFTMSTGDAATITGQFWSSESASQVTAALKIFVYRWTGSGTTLSTSDEVAGFSCADPGTSATSCVPTAVAPAHTVNFAATDRLVVIAGMNVSASRSGATVSMYFDSTARAASQVTLAYTPITPNKPTLTGSLDDDFTTGVSTTSCGTGGTTVNTKWTCLQGSATSSTGSVNEGALNGTIGGDTSGWLKLDNQFTAAGTSSNFGTTPSNTFLYQTLPTAYGDGTVRTVTNSTLNFTIGATNATTPYNHVGVVLWTSNTDYLEVQLYSDSAINGSTTNTAKVALNNSGTLSGATGINSTVSNGLYGRVWLGFSNTGGSWQAQYSTDGSTWNNIGSPVSHSPFTRVGLNAFTALGSASGDYAGAFEWFSSTLASVTYNQTNYQWLANANSTVPGAKLTASQSTAYTLTSTGQQFRLRQLIKASGQVGVSGQTFNEQVAPLASFGNCSSIPTASWITMNSGSQNLVYGPTAAVNSGSGAAWSNLSNIYANDQIQFATVSPTNGQSSQAIHASGYGFNIPSTATINGIVVKVSDFAASSSFSEGIQLLKGVGLSLGSKGTATMPTALTTETFGTSTDLWGDTWTPADINSSSFGVHYLVTNSSGATNTASVDYISVTVYYTYTSGGIFYFNNSTPASGANIAANAGDPTESGQTVQPETYQEGDGFTDPTVYGSSVDGEWDLSLYDNGATAGTTYCFRMVKSDGTPLDTYTNYPMITTYSAVVAPTTDQFMRGGEYFNSGSKQPYYWAQ